MTNPLAKYPVTQTWAQHVANTGMPGSVLGGVDYAMPIGTPLPILDGEMEWVTPWSLRKPAWYNTGLGNAAAYRRPDGTRTVYAHNSTRIGRQVYSGNSGLSSGPHVHAHDVLADGRTRVPPFSTIPEEEKEAAMTYVQLIKTKNSLDPKKRVYEKFTPAGTVQLLGQAIAAEHNLQTGAPNSLDGTSSKSRDAGRVALVRQLWSIEQEAYRALHQGKEST